MFSDPRYQDSSSVLAKARMAREARATDRVRETSAVKIQSIVRLFLVRRRFLRSTLNHFDEILKSWDQLDPSAKLISGADFFDLLRRFLFATATTFQKYIKRYEVIARYIISSIGSNKFSENFGAIVLKKPLTVSWIKTTKTLLSRCCTLLTILKPELSHELKSVATFLSVLVALTSPQSWNLSFLPNPDAIRQTLSGVCCKILLDTHTQGVLLPSLKVLLKNGLCRDRSALTPATLSAISTLCTRLLSHNSFSDETVIIYMINILAVPAYIYHLNLLASDCVATLVSGRVFSKCTQVLLVEQNNKIVFNSLQGTLALCLLANLVQLGELEMEGLVERPMGFMAVVDVLLQSCKRYVETKRSNNSHWHPVLGWFSQKPEQSLHEAMPHVTKQLQRLWSEKMVRILFSDLLSYTSSAADERAAAASAAEADGKKKGILKLVRGVTKSGKSQQTPKKIRLESPLAAQTCAACSMYKTALATLTQLRMDILAGLSYQKAFLPNLWCFIRDLGPNCGLSTLISVLQSGDVTLSHQVFDMITLFCDAASHLIVILDDTELYEQEDPFKLNDLLLLSNFLNLFVFTLVWHGIIDVREMPDHPMLTSALTLLSIIYERDCRRSFAPENHWLIREVKPSVFIAELERTSMTGSGTSKAFAAQYLLTNMPQIIPFKERVILFRKNVLREKESLGVLVDPLSGFPQSTLVTIHRSHLTEDGYRQLSQLPVKLLKGTIRVKFVNMQGLDEAGIDQDGVFKEFLEETISRVFDPGLNLFKVTSDHKLYPSPTSYIQDGHLLLFEFVGKMLGKALYEGIVVDVPFAPFFLTQLLGRHGATYSFIDELPSLDAELYRSLTFIKHYDGDVKDLELCFSYDEEVLGKVVAHDLVTGGRLISVTNDNKLHYIHLIAQFRMYKQIKKQTQAFTSGFRSVVRPDWLRMFSAPELQKLISGDNTDIDLTDLRKHCQYYGGYHSNHKVIGWLWEILEKDFSSEDRRLFLKFVTSCSKPPLLGFSTLEPPFSIRCVEMGEDQDTGDTVGTVLKGFFNIRKKELSGRLPTSSTCFNLLKLPNYSKKSLMREKLRYAIRNNTGFELS